MLKRWAAWPPGIRWLVGIAAVVLVAAILWALFVPVPDWLARHDVGSANPALVQTARDAARGRLLTLGAGLFAAGALAFTALNFILSREGQVTDRYTKAIEQLGSDKLDVRIGGVYALERVARDSAKDHPTVMEVLTAFIREHSREPWPPPDTGSGTRTGAASRALSSTTRNRRSATTVRHLAARSSSSTSNPPEQERVTRSDVQAAVTVVRRRDAKRDIRRIDLTGADLYLADFTGADFTGADFTGADLTGADLTGGRLRGANLREADLYLADLTGADLREADLRDADLTGARLTTADLRKADLEGARLIGPDPTGAHFFPADLHGANLRLANLRDADLTGVPLISADLAGAVLAAARLTGAHLTRARFTNANLRDVDLTDADDVAGADLAGADLTGVSWPEGVPVPGGWIVDSNSSRLKYADELSEVMGPLALVGRALGWGNGAAAGLRLPRIISDSAASLQNRGPAPCRAFRIIRACWHCSLALPDSA